MCHNGQLCSAFFRMPLQDLSHFGVEYVFVWDIHSFADDLTGSIIKPAREITLNRAVLSNDGSAFSPINPLQLGLALKKEEKRYSIRLHETDVLVKVVNRA